MAQISISSIDGLIVKYAEEYSVSDLFKINEVKELLDKGGAIPDGEVSEVINVYMRFVAHKLIFQGGKDLEINVAAIIGCGCEVEIPMVKIPYNRKGDFKEFCAAYVRTCFNLGLCSN